MLVNGENGVCVGFSVTAQTVLLTGRVDFNFTVRFSLMLPIVTVYLHDLEAASFYRLQTFLPVGGFLNLDTKLVTIFGHRHLAGFSSSEIITLVTSSATEPLINR